MNEDEIKELKICRFQYLNKFYDMVDGGETIYLNYEKVGKELGFDKDQSYKIAEYLSSEGLLKFATLGGGMQITHLGIKEVEQAISAPDQPTSHFLPISIINVQTMNNSQIQQGVHNSNQTQTIAPNESNELKDELDSKLNEICKDLKFNLKTWNKNRVYAIILGLISVIPFVIGMQFIPSGMVLSNVPEITLPMIGSFLVMIFFAGKKFQKGEKARTKNLGYNALTLWSYQALEDLEKYKDDLDFDHIKNSKEKLKSISDTLENIWDATYKYNLTFKSLESPIEKFKKSLSENFIPAYLDIDLTKSKLNVEELKTRKTSLIHLIQLFQSNNFQLIEGIVEELNNYAPIQKVKEKTKWQKFLENRTKVKIITSLIGSALIIVGATILSYFISQHPNVPELEKYPNFITWSIQLSGIGIVIFNAIIVLWKNK